MQCSTLFYTQSCVTVSRRIINRWSVVACRQSWNLAHGETFYVTMHQPTFVQYIELIIFGSHSSPLLGSRSLVLSVSLGANLANASRKEELEYCASVYGY